MSVARMPRALFAWLATVSACTSGARLAEPLDLSDDKSDQSTRPRDASPLASAWRRQVIYLVLPDRFANGNPANDALGLPGCLDASDGQKFHGGDLAGLRAHVDYLAELGVGAVWSTPLYRQAVGPSGRCGYHGYWGDFTDPD